MREDFRKRSRAGYGEYRSVGARMTRFFGAKRKSVFDPPEDIPGQHLPAGHYELMSFIWIVLQHQKQRHN